MKLNNIDRVFASLVRCAQHSVTDEAITLFERFVENDETTYTFMNTHGESYTLTVDAPSATPVLSHFENDYSGDPAVVSLTNTYLAYINKTIS